MGCEQSKLSQLTTTPLSIIDPAFLNPHNPHNSTLQQHHIHPQPFLTLHSFLESAIHSYAHHIVVRQADLNGLREGLSRLKMDPMIYVLSKGKRQGKEDGARIAYFEDYSELPCLLQQQKKTQEPQVVKTSGKNVLVRILKDLKGQSASQVLILQQTLKAKDISYQLYSTFGQLQRSASKSPLLVVDYRFHRAVMALNPYSKVICLCDLTPQQTYDPKLFFFTNNFQEVVAEALLFKGLAHPSLPISKAFFCSVSPELMQYGSVLEYFSLKVRAFATIDDLIRVTRLYFSVMVICLQKDGEAIEKKIREVGCGWRMRVIKIAPGTECSPLGLRSIVKEVKRGYLVSKGPSKTVDIIDKYHSSSKFSEIKKELTTNGIAFKCYPSISNYCKTLPFIAPVVICNFEDRILLYKFLGEVKSQAKVVIFCNQNKITEQVCGDGRWSFVSSHFGKIMKHIRANHVLIPLLQHNSSNSSKGKDHRVSAKQWAQQQLQSSPHHQFAIADITPQTTQCIQLLKLARNPLSSLGEFRKDLFNSLNALIRKCRLNIHDEDLTKITKEFCSDDLRQLGVRVRRFLGEEKEVGLGINSILKGIDSASAEAVKEVIFLLSLNFLAPYQLPHSQSLRLCCWTQEQALKDCEKGSVVTCRNFLVMREEVSAEQLAGCVRLELDLEYSPLKWKHAELSPFFAFEGRYVLAPFSQLKVSGVEVVREERVVRVSLLQDNAFLEQYFCTNLAETPLKVFKNQLAKGDTVLAQVQYLPNLTTNITRLQNYSLAKDPTTLPKALASQHQLIRLQQQSDNFDIRLLTQMKFQLLIYLSLEKEAMGSDEEMLQLISEIKEGSPSTYVKRECGGILARMKDKLEKGTEHAKTSKCIELQQQIQQDSEEEKSQEGLPIVDQQHYENIFQCLEVDECEGLTEQFA